MNIEALVSGKRLNQPITRPTLFIWGSNDFAVAPSVVAKQRPFIRGPYKEIRLDADHALIQHTEDAVIAAVLAHLKAVYS